MGPRNFTRAAELTRPLFRIINNLRYDRQAFGHYLLSLLGIDAMTVTPKAQNLSQPKIVRTERGLTVSGSRITIYDVMDYYPKHSIAFVREALPFLSEVQLQVAIDYIESNREEVETEYQIVVRQAEETELYWREENRERFAQIAAMPLTPEKVELRKKVADHRAKLADMNEATD